MATSKENLESEFSTTDEEECNLKPTCIIVLGMAGSGKTTFVQVLIFSFLCSVHVLLFGETSGAFILEHVSEIMADICNNNYIIFILYIIMATIISPTCSKIKVPNFRLLTSSGYF